MPEQRHPPQSPAANLYEIFEEMVDQFGGDSKNTHGRFSIAHTDSIDVVVTGSGNDNRERLLIARETPESGALYATLVQAGVPQFERNKDGNEAAIYRLPPHVKPLIHERFFVDRESSETYVSDKEIFTRLGALWAQVYKATGMLPQTPLRLTAVQNFEEISQLLVPIPPYTTWDKHDDESHAYEIFSIRAAAELDFSNPSATHEGLLDAMKNGWNEYAQS